MAICFACKHLLQVWPEGTAVGRSLGKNNYGCKASQVEPVVHPVTGEIWGGVSSIEIEERMDHKTVGLTFYRICEDVNEGNCPMYEEKS